MEDAQGIGKLLQMAGDLLDMVSLLLARVGIDLSSVVLQLFLLVIIGALAWPVYKKVRARQKADRLPLVYAVVLGLAGLGIVIGIVENGTTPSRVSGQVKSAQLGDIRVALLDYRDQVISVDSGMVDTATGRFALHYSPLINGRARKLRIGATGCREQDHALPRAQLRAGSDVTWEYLCTTPALSAAPTVTEAR